VTVFIVICAVFAALAVLSVVWPLLRTRAAGPAAEASRSGIAATLVAALLPLVAFAAYFWASNWSWDTGTPAGSVAARNPQQMVKQLQDRLVRNPDDLEGWKFLGRSATVLGDYVLARQAFGEAYTRSKGQDADAVTGYAESLVLNDEREIDGHAAELFEQALRLNPDNARALWYGGIIAYRRGDLPLAQQRWVELQNYDLPPDLRQVLAEKLSEIARTQGQPASGKPSSESAQSVSVVHLRIDISPKMLAQVSPGSTLFVIARRGETGPPLAVVRRPIGKWPLELTMTDADAMLPGIRLAGGGSIRVIARISRNGEPIAASGDLYGEVGYDFSSASPVNVTIDRIVP
jgi:cytochrome c-type biogenesis protein CcmH